MHNKFVFSSQGRVWIVVTKARQRRVEWGIKIEDISVEEDRRCLGSSFPYEYKICKASLSPAGLKLIPLQLRSGVITLRVH